jgi:hypothetical protein
MAKSSRMQELGVEEESKIGMGKPPNRAAENGRQRGGMLIVDIDGDEGALGEVDP